jgi:hypothetical protein
MAHRKNTSAKKVLAITALIVLIAAFRPSVPAAQGQDGGTPCTPSTICVDGAGTGRVFEGVGGLSAGAASRFLIDYPEPYQSQILDYLFKPYYGASLQHLKLEIGGDTNSSWGAEPSHMHSRDDENYRRGYEWWLMAEARKRNPKILIDLLPWGAPGWIGNHHFYSQDMIEYDLKFINAAQQLYGVGVDYLGVWNETRYDKNWIKSLKQALLTNNQQRRLHTQLVAADGVVDGWHVADDMSTDWALLAAVDVVGAHYPEFRSTPTAQNLRRGGSPVPLWDSEDTYLIYSGAPAGILAKELNRNYILGKMTKLVHCTVAAAFPGFLPYREGLVIATSPWSGHYDVSPALWGIAHTTQFAQPGWQYIDSASGILHGAGGKDRGSYVTLKAPNGSDYSIIIETADAESEQQFTFEVRRGLSSGPLHVWHSDTKSENYFVREADLPAARSHRLVLQPASIYSLTTTTGQHKGDAGGSPAAFALPQDYFNDFENAPLDQPAHYFADQEGSFEVAPCTGKPGRCLRQTVDQPPIAWTVGLNKRYIRQPFTFLGDQENRAWTDYQVSVDVLLEDSGSVTLWGRLDHFIPCTNNDFACVEIQQLPDGYALNLDTNGKWSLNKSLDNGAGVTRIQWGYLPDWRPAAWHTLKMAFRGFAIDALIDGKPLVKNYLDSSRTHTYGMVALGTEWNHVQFDNFCVRAVCP